VTPPAFNIAREVTGWKPVPRGMGFQPVIGLITRSVMATLAASRLAGRPVGRASRFPEI